IDPEYWDIWGRKHLTSTETKQAILRAMGVDTSTAESIAHAIAEREEQERSRLAPPCVVISENARPRVAPLHAPAGPTVRVRIQREDGGEQCYEATASDSSTATLPLPLDLPLGYHDVEVALGEQRASMRLIIAPDRA